MNQNQMIFGYPASTVAFVAVALLLLLSQSFVVIQPGFEGVSVTLGKADPKSRESGLHMKVPFIEDIYKIPVKQLTVPGKAECFSSDLQTVIISFSALYRIPNSQVVDLFVNYRGEQAYNELMYPRIQDSLKQVAALYRAEDLVKSREDVKSKAIAIIRKTLRLKNGFSSEDVLAIQRQIIPLELKLKEIAADAPERQVVTEHLLALAKEESQMLNDVPLLNLVDLPINNIDLTENLEHAIEEKQIKEQEALAKKYELDKARRDAEITVVNATAEAKAVTIKGAALRSAPEVIELEIAKKWDGKSPATVVVGKGGSNVLLPLR